MDPDFDNEIESSKSPQVCLFITQVDKMDFIPSYCSFLGFIICSMYHRYCLGLFVEATALKSQHAFQKEQQAHLLGRLGRGE